MAPNRVVAAPYTRGTTVPRKSGSACAAVVSFAASIRSRSSRHGPTFGCGHTWWPYPNSVAPERNTLCTVFCDTFSSQTICLIDLSLPGSSRLTRCTGETARARGSVHRKVLRVIVHPYVSYPRPTKGASIGCRNSLHSGWYSIFNNTLKLNDLEEKG
jgi:hypothetical protein